MKLTVDSFHFIYLFFFFLQVSRQFPVVFFFFSNFGAGQQLDGQFFNIWSRPLINGSIARVTRTDFIVTAGIRLTAKSN